jgi:hypothetical protein
VGKEREGRSGIFFSLPFQSSARSHKVRAVIVTYSFTLLISKRTFVNPLSKLLSFSLTLSLAGIFEHFDDVDVKLRRRQGKG